GLLRSKGNGCCRGDRYPDARDFFRQRAMRSADLCQPARLQQRMMAANARTRVTDSLTWLSAAVSWSRRQTLQCLRGRWREAGVERAEADLVRNDGCHLCRWPTGSADFFSAPAATGKSAAS